LFCFMYLRREKYSKEFDNYTVQIEGYGDGQEARKVE